MLATYFLKIRFTFTAIYNYNMYNNNTLWLLTASVSQSATTDLDRVLGSESSTRSEVSSDDAISTNTDATTVIRDTTSADKVAETSKELFTTTDASSSTGATTDTEVGTSTDKPTNYTASSTNEASTNRAAVTVIKDTNTSEKLPAASSKESIMSTKESTNTIYIPTSAPSGTLPFHLPSLTSRLVTTIKESIMSTKESNDSES